MFVCYDNELACQWQLAATGLGDGISTEKYVNRCHVTRTPASRELTALCEMGVTVQMETGRGTLYPLAMCCQTDRSCRTGLFQGLPQLLHQQGVDLPRIGLAFAGFHDRADQTVQSF